MGVWEKPLFFWLRETKGQEICFGRELQLRANFLRIWDLLILQFVFKIICLSPRFWWSKSIRNIFQAKSIILLAQALDFWLAVPDAVYGITKLRPFLAGGFPCATPTVSQNHSHTHLCQHPHWFTGGCWGLHLCLVLFVSTHTLRLC